MNFLAPQGKTTHLCFTELGVSSTGTALQGTFPASLPLMVGLLWTPCLTMSISSWSTAAELPASAPRNITASATTTARVARCLLKRGPPRQERTPPVVVPALACSLPDHTMDVDRHESDGHHTMDVDRHENDYQHTMYADKHQNLSLIHI